MTNPPKVSLTPPPCSKNWQKLTKIENQQKLATKYLKLAKIGRLFRPQQSNSRLHRRGGGLETKARFSGFTVTIFTRCGHLSTKNDTEKKEVFGNREKRRRNKRGRRGKKGKDRERKEKKGKERKRKGKKGKEGGKKGKERERKEKKGKDRKRKGRKEKIGKERKR